MGDFSGYSDYEKNTGSTPFQCTVGVRIADSEDRGRCSVNAVFKGFWICFAQFRLPFFVRFAFLCCLIPLRRNRVMGNSGQLPMPRIGNGSIIILTCTIRTITTRLSIIRVDRIFTTAIRRRCRFPPTIRRGLIFIPHNVVTITVIILGSIFFSSKSPNRSFVCAFKPFLSLPTPLPLSNIDLFVPLYFYSFSSVNPLMK